MPHVIVTVMVAVFEMGESSVTVIVPLAPESTKLASINLALHWVQYQRAGSVNPAQLLFVSMLL